MGEEVSYTIDASYQKGTNMLEKSRRQVVRFPLKFINRNQKKIQGNHSYTVDTANTGGVAIRVPEATKKGYTTTPVIEALRIRRLTPKECERLQGFPDNWTQYGIIDGKKVVMSDTQRYKMMGNAVTVNVVRDVITALLQSMKLK